MGKPVVYTVGHGARSGDDFLAILKEGWVGLLVDVRRFPGSRRHPQFGRDALAESVPAVGILYDWQGERLGGRRSAKRKAGAGPSRHPAWRVEAFRNYADWMDGADFREALAEIEETARTGSAPAVMCAETLWWRCHRRLIADALVAHGFEVVHLLGLGKRQEHPLHPQARIVDGWPVYDRGEDGALPLP